MNSCHNSFLSIYERTDEHYRIYSRLLENGNFCVKLLCVNPIQNWAECLSQGRAATFFSATMLPIRYYRELLSNEPRITPFMADFVVSGEKHGPLITIRRKQTGV